MRQLLLPALLVAAASPLPRAGTPPPSPGPSSLAPSSLAPDGLAPDGLALVIGADGTPGAETGGAVCDASARAVAARLAHDGFKIDLRVEPTVTGLRSALDDLAGTLADHVPQRTAVYVCTRAQISNGRLFLLPGHSEANPDPATQGVLASAVTAAAAGSGGMVFLDLAVGSGTISPQPSLRVPPGVRATLALFRPTGHPPPLGQALAAGQPDLRLAVPPPPGPAPAPLPAPVPPPPLPVPVSPPAAPAVSDQIAEPEPLPPRLPESGSAPGRHHPTRPRTARHVSPPPPSPAPAAPETAASPRIGRLQVALARHGLYGGPENGLVDAPTTDAIRRFQALVGDQETGVLTQAEIVLLLNS